MKHCVCRDSPTYKSGQSPCTAIRRPQHQSHYSPLPRSRQLKRATYTSTTSEVEAVLGLPDQYECPRTASQGRVHRRSRCSSYQLNEAASGRGRVNQHEPVRVPQQFRPADTENKAPDPPEVWSCSGQDEKTLSRLHVWLYGVMFG